MSWLPANVALLIFLYFIQGLPYGFQTRFLPVYLHSVGVSLTDVGLIRLLQIPWLLKTIWAPVIDYYSTKRKWLLCSISGLLLTCFLGSLLSVDSFSLAILLLLLNIFSVTQDIVVDTVAIGILHSERDLSLGNTAQVVAYKIGSIFGSGLLLFFVNFFGWSGMFVAVAVLYAEALMFVFLSPVLRDHEKTQLSQKLKNAVYQNQFADAENDDSTTVNCYCQLHYAHCCHCYREKTSASERTEESKKDQHTNSSSSNLKDSKANYFYSLIQVDCTWWMISFLLLYKLGELICLLTLKFSWCTYLFALSFVS